MIKIALAGNPNSGKTTLFNALTGSNQFVGNWPGVTVEKKEGKLKKNDNVIVTDLPGIYSLSPYTLEEVVARNYLIDEHPDVILNLVDATNIERNLYLTTQLCELGIPVVIALNMMDIVRKAGDKIDIDVLSKNLSCPVIEISALKNEGIDEAVKAAIEQAEAKTQIPKHFFSGVVEHALAHIEEAVVHELENEEKQRWYAIKLFERDEKVISQLKATTDVLSHIEKDIKAVERALDDDSESIITNERYNYVSDILKTCYVKKVTTRLTITEKIDKIVTNRILALPIFAIIMFFVYFISVTTIGTWTTDWINDCLFGEGFHLFGINEVWIPGIPVLVESGLEAINCWDWLQDLILNGIIPGVGSVLSFVPQMLILFLMLSFLEGCGYMSRIAFVLDRIFRHFGLSGKSFIPMLVGVGCSVPGIMASRTVESESDRKVTIITTSFIPCGAKLPFIALIAGAIFDGAWWVAPVAYFVGMLAVLITGIILKQTKPFESQATPFVMELPLYHMPTFGSLMKNTWDRGWSFIKKAGTIILLSSIVIWFLSSYGFDSNGFGAVDMEYSILSYIGKGVSWIFAPVGFGTGELGWRATVASITGLVAKENIVASLEVLYTNGATNVYEALSQAFSGPAAFSFLMFNLLCAPCFAAMGAIKKEMNSGKWTAFAIIYQCVFAYLVSFVCYHFGNLFTGALFNGGVNLGWGIVGLVISVLIIALFVFMIIRPDKKKKQVA